jgi:hypothetical protein
MSHGLWDVMSQGDIIRDYIVEAIGRWLCSLGHKKYCGTVMVCGSRDLGYVPCCVGCGKISRLGCSEVGEDIGCLQCWAKLQLLRFKVT